MKPFWKQVCAAMLMGFVAPAMMMWAAVSLIPPRQLEITEQTSLPPETTLRTAEQETWYIPVLVTGVGVQEMELDTYLVGVVLAEMPVSFEEEALKAQAVVARTYTLKAFLNGGKHSEASVCTDSTCCQSYISTADFIGKGGSMEDVERIENIVTDTEGLVLTYDGALIEATYFSCSGGSTEDAQAVWGTDIPYLQATASPGEEYASHYTDTETFSAQEFQSLLGVSLTGSGSNWFGNVRYTAGGGVATMEIGGEEFTGMELRKLLGLRSTAITMTTDGETITVTTKGFGHRVGMSQYGADAMAVSGSSFQEILAHYYKGTVLETYRPSDN